MQSIKSIFYFYYSLFVSLYPLALKLFQKKIFFINIWSFCKCYLVATTPGAVVAASCYLHFFHIDFFCFVQIFFQFYLLNPKKFFSIMRYIQWPGKSILTELYFPPHANKNPYLCVLKMYLWNFHVLCILWLKKRMMVFCMEFNTEWP